MTPCTIPSCKHPARWTSKVTGYAYCDKHALCIAEEHGIVNKLVIAPAATETKEERDE